MKKIQKMLVALVIAFASFLSLAACGDGDKIIGAQVMTGTMATTVAKGGIIDTSKAKVQVEYKDSFKTVDASELEFGAVDTSVVGNTKMKIKYGDYEFEVTIKVVATEADVSSISLLESGVWERYKANKKEQTNKQDEFVDRTAPLYVGDDNKFNFRISASGRDGANRAVIGIEKVRTNITVEKKNGTDYDTLDAATLASFVEIDTENTTLDFTSDAVGEEFRVTVEAVNKDVTAEESATKFTVEFTVVDGYNVYNATDLSVYDNTNRGGVWTEKKAATGMTNVTADAIILQDDIVIHKEDVPAAFFWNKATEGTTSEYQSRQVLLGSDTELNGTVKDYSDTGLYRRTLTDGDVFTIHGNYFRIDLSDFPKAVTGGVEGAGDDFIDQAEGEMMTSHFSVFFNVVEDATTLHSKTSVDIDGVRFYGNGGLNTEVENSGAIILMKNHWVDLNAYNTLQKNFYIGYFVENGLRDDVAENGKYSGNFLVDSCKGYDSYQCLFYCWGAEKLIIKNSEFMNAGGPAIIGSHGGIVDNDPETGAPTNVDIIASTVSSEVVGTEPWFVKYGSAAVVQQLPLLEGLLAGQTAIPATDKSIYVRTEQVQGTTVNKLNLVACLLSGSAEGISGQSIRGHVRIFDTQAEYDAYYAASPEKTTYGLEMGSELDARSKANHGIYIEANGNGGYINSGVQTNWDTSYLGFLQMTFLETVLADAIPLVEQQMGVSYSSLSFEQKKTALQGAISAIAEMSDGLSLLQQLYGGGLVKNAQVVEGEYIGVGKDMWPELTGADQAKLANAAQLAQYLCGYVAQIQAPVSFTEGSHLNLYLGDYGVGLVLGTKTKN
ncbi:MAG: hypothetical protein E7354_04735 [Clostridiales bacterium]|nr:hypothetical protein [Clostridiales bacterium]